jgi:hypothetical protein
MLARPFVKHLSFEDDCQLPKRGALSFISAIGNFAAPEGMD